MCQTVPLFILLFTEIPCRYRKTQVPVEGYLCNDMCTAAETTASPHVSSPVTKVAETPESDITLRGSDHIPAEGMPTLLVAGISIFVMFLIILVIIGVWCAWKKSKGSLAEMNFDPSGEHGVSLERISRHEH